MEIRLIYSGFAYRGIRIKPITQVKGDNQESETGAIEQKEIW